jgi:hypothetical protein
VSNAKINPSEFSEMASNAKTYISENSDNKNYL